MQRFSSSIMSSFLHLLISLCNCLALNVQTRQGLSVFEFTMRYTTKRAEIFTTTAILVHVDCDPVAPCFARRTGVAHQSVVDAWDVMCVSVCGCMCVDANDSLEHESADDIRL
jgi:hypothetical protein